MWSNDPLVGKKIERCLVEKPLGRGGHALVYLAYDQELKEHRVLKIALPNMGSREFAPGQEVQAFLEEGILLSRLKHAQIVTLRSQGNFEGSRYMLLDYIRGPSVLEILDHVSKRVAETGCLWSQVMPATVALAIITSAARPLAYAHSANVHMPGRETLGVAHRDISPSNLILGSRGDERGKVVLIDFGTAKIDLNSMTTMRNGPVGTIPYMSMVRLQKSRGETPTHLTFWSGFRETRHDVHALGTLLYQLLTGNLPFPGEGAPQIIASIMNSARYTEFATEAEAILPGTGSIISQCIVWNHLNLSWNQQPQQFPDAVHLLVALEALYSKCEPQRSTDNLLRNFLESLPPTPDFPLTSITTPIAVVIQRSIPKKTAFYLIGAFLVLLLIGSGFYFLVASKPVETENEMPSWDSILATNPDPETEPIPDTLRSVSRATKPIVKPVAKPLSKKTNLNSLFSRDDFLELQGMVRTDPYSSKNELMKAELKFPQSIEIRFLKCQVAFKLEEWGQDFRNELELLLQKNPEFTNPKLYRENLSYWRWRNDQTLYQKNPESDIFRTNIAQSVNEYLREFGENPVLRAKISGKALEE